MITRDYLLSKGYTEAEVEAIDRELYQELLREEGPIEDWVAADPYTYDGEEFLEWDDVPF
jgi:hypothetical protein